MVRQGVLQTTMHSGNSLLFDSVRACLGPEALERLCSGRACQAGVRLLPALVLVVAMRPVPAVAAAAVGHPIDHSVHPLHRAPSADDLVDVQIVKTQIASVLLAEPSGLRVANAGTVCLSPGNMRGGLCKGGCHLLCRHLLRLREGYAGACCTWTSSS
jgi:hypothetical protein